MYQFEIVVGTVLVGRFLLVRTCSNGSVSLLDRDSNVR